MKTRYRQVALDSLMNSDAFKANEIDAEIEVERNNEIKEFQLKTTRIADMSYLNDSLTTSYASNAYMGD